MYLHNCLKAEEILTLSVSVLSTKNYKSFQKMTIIIGYKAIPSYLVLPSKLLAVSALKFQTDALKPPHRKLLQKSYFY
jgi:hypothetical protein